MYPVNFIAKCQSLTIKEQYEKGARLFDLRINFDKYDQPEFRHGLVSYKGSVTEILNYLNSLEDKGIYIRFIFENNLLEDPEESRFRENLFISFCADAQEKYKNLKFYGGNRKTDWKVLYKFPRKDLKITQIVGSMANCKLAGICPYIYAKNHNKENLANIKANEWVLMDFIEIQ